MSRSGGSESQGLLEEVGSDEDCCSGCCFWDDDDEIDDINMSDFGWFYTKYAKLNNEEKFNDLTTQIKSTELGRKDILEEAEVKNCMLLFVWFFLRVNIDEGTIIKEVDSYPRMRHTIHIRQELTAHVMRHYNDPDYLKIAELMSWMTIEMPRIYCQRCTKCCPEQFTCVIS